MIKKTFLLIAMLAVLLAQAQVKKDSDRARYSRRHFCQKKYSEYNAEYNSICQGCNKKRDFLRKEFQGLDIENFTFFFQSWV